MASNSLLDRLSFNQRVALAVTLFVVAFVVAFVSSRKKPEPQPPPGEPGTTLKNRNVRFGMPADAKHDPASKDAYLMERPQYVLSYNDAKKIPNWVCWNLSHTDIGKTARGAFAVDPDLPSGFRRIKHG